MQSFACHNNSSYYHFHEMILSYCLHLIINHVYPFLVFTLAPYFWYAMLCCLDFVIVEFLVHHYFKRLSLLIDNPKVSWYPLDYIIFITGWCFVGFAPYFLIIKYLWRFLALVGGIVYVVYQGQKGFSFSL